MGLANGFIKGGLYLVSWIGAGFATLYGFPFARPYANDLIFLFMGGFFIAVTMERWGLHRRIALGILSRVGSGPHQLVLGFMLARMEFPASVLIAFFAIALLIGITMTIPIGGAD